MSKFDRFAWLDQRREDAIDPDRRIVDPHHHLWDRGGSTYLAGELLSDLTASHNMVGSVFVECAAGYLPDGPEHLRPVGETAFVAAEAAQTRDAAGPVIGGIVSHADMMLGDAVEEVLAAHEAAGDGLFRGIRHATSFDASPDIREGHSKPFESMVLTDQFRDGVRSLGRMGHSFDAWLFHPQLPELATLAAAAPETTIVLDHLGAPMGIGPYAGRRDEVRTVWKASMEEVAAQANVVLKVGGIGMEDYYGMGWRDLPQPPGSEEVAHFWGDDVRWCIDLFGPSRCMLESNFPVDRQTLPYTVLWNAMQIMVADYDNAEQDALFAGTAERVYRLDLTA